MKRLIICSVLFLVMFSVVPAQDFSITMDAEKDAFYDGITDPNDGKIYFPAMSALREGTFIVPSSDADLSGIMWSAWDEQYLYYYFEITDDIILNNNSGSSGSQWSNDKVEIKYDADPNVFGTSNVMQVGMSAYGDEDAQDPGAVDNLHQDQDMRDPSLANVWQPTPEDYARKELIGGDNNPYGYVLEFRIPVEYLNKGDRFFGEAAEGKIFGVAINIADNDETARDAMLQWSAGHADAAWNNAQLHGTVTLLADHKIKYEAVCAQDPSVVNDSAQAWYFPKGASSVQRQLNDRPESFNLAQNYPNPFNPSTVIRYSLEKQEAVTLTVYNMAGEVVRDLLADQSKRAGTHEIVWDARDNSGANVSSGVYFYKLRAGSLVTTKKMILLR